MPNLVVVFSCCLLSLFGNITWNFFQRPSGQVVGGFQNWSILVGFASSSPITAVDSQDARPPASRAAFRRVALKPVKLHRANFVTLRERLSLPSGGTPGPDKLEAIQCTIQFEGPVVDPPILTLGPAQQPAGPFLSIFRDTHPSAHGWIHGYQKGIHPDSSVKLGAAPAGEGEYVEVHPPSGEHLYELMVFDQDYQLGPKLSALIGTPWHNKDRALGGEDAVVNDIRAGNDQSDPQIIGRCSVTVSHEQVAMHEDM